MAMEHQRWQLAEQLHLTLIMLVGLLTIVCYQIIYTVQQSLTFTITLPQLNTKQVGLFVAQMEMLPTHCIELFYQAVRGAILLQFHQ